MDEESPSRGYGTQKTPYSFMLLATVRLVPAFLPSGDAATLSVMSYNLRYPALDRHPWPERKPIAAALIDAESPHVIGTQEGVIDQLEDLIEALPDRYVWLGEGRNGGNDGEFTAVFYDSERLRPESVEQFWLSETPGTPGSMSWGSRHPRVTTSVDFQDLVTGSPLRVLNTHLDHKSQEARRESVRLIRERVESAGTEAVVLGDFNVAQGDEVHAALLAGGLLADPWETAGVALVGDRINTFHGYRRPKTEGVRIDWILTTGGLETVSAGVNAFAIDGQYPSDHAAVQALLRPRTA